MKISNKKLEKIISEAIIKEMTPEREFDLSPLANDIILYVCSLVKQNNMTYDELKEIWENANNLMFSEKTISYIRKKINPNFGKDSQNPNRLY